MARLKIYSKDQVDRIADDLTAEIDMNTADIATNRSNISVNAGAIAQNASDIAALSGRVTTAEGAIGQNAADIATNRGNIAQHASDIAALSGRMTAAETDIDANAAAIAQNTSDISALSGRMTAAETDIAQNTSDISALSGRMTAAETALAGKAGTDLNNVNVGSSHAGKYLAVDTDGSIVFSEGPAPGPSAESDVNLVDWDGTLLYSYTRAEFNALTAYPALPADSNHVHRQSWAIPLAEAQSRSDVRYIGACACSDDGYWHFLRQCYAGETVEYSSAVLSWGDGATGGTSHTYSAAGIFDIVRNDLTFPNKGKTKILSVLIPNSVTMIGDSTFYICFDLQSVTIPAGVTSIEEDAFDSCYTLQYVTIPAGVRSIGEDAFSNCYALQSLTIPAGVTSIEDSTFDRCYALQYVTIPAGVTSIGEDAFNTCYTLQYVTIPAGVTSIEEDAFYRCFAFITSYTENDVYANITVYNALDLTALTTVPASPPVMNNSYARVIVSSNMLSAFQSAWSGIASQIISG